MFFHVSPMPNPCPSLQRVHCRLGLSCKGMGRADGRRVVMIHFVTEFERGERDATGVCFFFDATDVRVSSTERMYGSVHDPYVRCPRVQ